MNRPVERIEEHIAPMHAQKNRRLSTVACGQVSPYQRILGPTKGRSDA